MPGSVRPSCPLWSAVTFARQSVFALLLLMMGASSSWSAGGDHYERARFELALKDGGFTVDPAPDGKRIRTIHVVRHDVFADDELIPTFLNAFHWLTDEDIIARELTFAEGERFDRGALEETKRNLRGMGIFSLVVVDAVTVADATSEVDVVVYTRDLWSLRLETRFNVTDLLINQLKVTLIERNFFGRQTQAGATFELLPLTWSTDAFYVDRRVLGSDWALSASAGIIGNRTRSGLEGARGSLEVGIPLYNLARRWGFEIDFDFDTRIARRLTGADVATYDIPETDEEEAIPRVWDQDALSLSVSGRYQVGRDTKHRLTFGWTVSDTTRRANDETGLLPDQRDAFRRDVFGPDRRQSSPFLTYTAFRPTYRSLVDVAAYGISEDIRIGPWWKIEAALPLRAFGSSSNSALVGVSGGWILTPGEGAGAGLIDLRVGASARVEQSRLIDQTYTLVARGATPRFVLGRGVFSARWTNRREDTRGTLVSLGGDNGLRGFASQALFGFGASSMLLNAELRSPPVVWQFLHLGAVAFWDAGAVYEKRRNLRLEQSVGGGLRFLFPQFNRFAFRLDAGIPLSSPGFTILLSFGTLQAVSLTELEDSAR